MATNAIQFNGSTQYGRVDNFSGLDGLTDHTVEMWVKNSSSSVAYSPYFVIDDGVNRFSKVTTENGTGNEGFNFSVNFSGSDADGYESSSRFVVDTWKYLALVYDHTLLKTSVFVGGVENSFYDLQSTATGTIQDSTGFNLNIARDGRVAEYLNGYIGGFVRVWNRKLTGGEIYYNYDKILTPANESGLIINCNFTEGSGTTVDNDATPGEDIDLYNNPTWVTGPTLNTKTYPYTSLYRQITESTDDAEQYKDTNNVSLTSSDYEIPADGGTSQYIGLRFQNITIPKGATIQSAYLRFAGDSDLSGTEVTPIIYGEDADSSSTFTTTNSDISNRTLTTASTNWPISSSTHMAITSTPDIKTIVQEVIDRAGWSSGNNISFIVDCLSDTTLVARFISYNGQPYSSAMLHVEYSLSFPSSTSKSNIKTTYYCGYNYDWKIAGTEGAQNRGYQS
ncbi:MAG: hypothetical protein KCHDKBKB_00783 [Elusimicrobia bacterium]|nr:hypothetical protein [Elusimicrobiota bacterium]